ncbi:enoyl-CoA hydratase/isomerase family protein [Mesorhizobium sp. B2-6-1]|uniref:enoyl-CoA hydratase/isomerase family protein n=1 Tax=Mesorhizobium sp. B2-6-1 TaxID=2589916 RepID=UPI0015E3B8E2|nr:enoyl-CoA hydratase/isomerase family protein [Mesorhizobium sp. B2-6-1]
MDRSETSPVLVRVQGTCGVLTLNAPSSLNALSLKMVQSLGQQLRIWQNDRSIENVVIMSSGGKAFSAGADVRAMWKHAVAQDYGTIDNYFEQEYALDLLLATFPKPCISLVNGICFGGGMAVSVHSRYCVTTGSARFSMPETLIGFFPDAGASWFLPRLAGSIGMYLGLTGAQLTGGDAVRLGLASHYVPEAEFADCLEAICRDGIAAADALSMEPPPLSFASSLAEIDACFGASGLSAIEQSLRDDGGDWATAVLRTLRDRSPASLAWTFDMLSRPGDQTLQQKLRQELEMVAVSTRHPDFREGVRATLIDKDRTPRWRRY